jgi:hypothetical protein
VRHDELSIDPSHLITGAKANAQTVAGQTAGGGIGQWDSGPASFCAGALKANNDAPTAVLDVKATFGGIRREDRALMERAIAGVLRCGRSRAWPRLRSLPNSRTIRRWRFRMRSIGTSTVGTTVMARRS